MIGAYGLRPIRCYDAFPSSTFFCKAFAEWYTIESIMPATVNTPPMIAHIPVKK